MHKKLPIAIGITFLFLGIAINPAIAVDPISSDNEDDCNLCAKRVSKTYLVLLKSLLNRVETLDNKFSVISKYNPKVAEEYQELSDRIITLSDMNKILNSNNLFNSTICVILTLIIVLYSIFILPLWILYRFSYNRELYLIREIVDKLLTIAFIPILPIWAIWFMNCTTGIIVE